MTTGSAARFPVVALVASAGGLDALTRVLGPLPADLPAAVLVARYQKPLRFSHLTSILAGRTALRVTEAVDGGELVPGVVVVVCGGTVFAQDEPTSEHFGMPGAAIGTGRVGSVLPLPRIAEAIVGHVGAGRGRSRGLARSAGATQGSGRPPLP